MRLRSLLACLALSVLSASVQAQKAYDFGVDIKKLTRRQNEGNRIIVTGAPIPEGAASNGTIPRRLELREMRLDQRKWDLFVLALSMFQYVRQDDPLSWYQIAGIHGVPFTTWNGVEPIPGADQSGYCTHSSVLFPTWHRPYLALFEQEVYRLANLIAGMYQDPVERQLYQQAASDIRIPYWDWAIDAPPGHTHFPEVFQSEIILQDGPRGRQNIYNPLYSYHFHPTDEEAFIWSPLKYWAETKRAPDTTVSITSPPSRNDQINAALLAKLPEIQQRLYILFSGYSDFNSFGNKAWATSQNLSTYDSIEAVHDIIHIYGGLKGHMTYVPLSAFDPMFFMHHAMTDRLIAMWQILNPKSWMSPMAAGETSYNTLKGTIQEDSTPLTPFFKYSDGTFWTSAEARDTQTFGYTYADTDPFLAMRGNFRGELARKITMWYGTSSPAALFAKSQAANTDSLARGAYQPPTPRIWKSKRRHSAHFDALRPNVKPDAADPPAGRIIRDNKFTEWIANVAVNVEALDGLFTIHFFVGEAPLNPEDWEMAQNQIGSVNIFAMNRNTGSQSKISGTLPLTSALMKLVAVGVIPSLDPMGVRPLILGGLQFRVIGSNDLEVDPRLVEGLFIDIGSAEVTMSESETELPRWGPLMRRIQLWPGEQ